MPDCFISHSNIDTPFAKQIKFILEKSGLSVFLAPDSIKGGEDWSDSILRNLNNSQWVFFLASKAACSSVRTGQPTYNP